jgi:ATP-dependent DNA helicase RecG
MTSTGSPSSASPRATAKPYVLRHRGREDIYIRVGSTSQLAAREQQARLFPMGGMLHTELMPVSGSSFRDLSKERLTDYLSAIVVGPKTVVRALRRPGSTRIWRMRC